jgi:hypothetical protein
MDVESALKDDVFRPLATTIVPGTLAIAPYILVSAVYVPEITQFWNDHPNAFIGIIAVVVIAAGLICEDIGSEIEVRIDRRLKKRDSESQTRWEKYLTLELDEHLVGRKYLKNVLLRFKFELAMIPALISLMIGLDWLNALHLYIPWQNLILIDAFILVGVGVLCYEAYQGAKVLDGVRKQILASYTRKSAASKSP